MRQRAIPIHVHKPNFFKCIFSSDLLKHYLVLIYSQNAYRSMVVFISVRLNGTMQNATFFEKQYNKMLSMYNNLQTTVHDIRNQQHILITQLQEKTREVNHLQKQLLTSSPSPVRMSR